jgi:hypothetical protein
MTYKEELEFLKVVEDPEDSTNNRERLPELEIQALLTKFPSLPSDYTDYLKEIGHGNFRECQFKIMSSLFDLSDLGLENHYSIRPTIKFFGDNFSGDFAGFDLNQNNGLVIEFWHEDGSIYETKKTFREYIRSHMLLDDNGNDLRV